MRRGLWLLSLLLAAIAVAVLIYKISQNKITDVPRDNPHSAIIKERVANYKKHGDNLRAVFKQDLPAGDFDKIVTRAAEMAAWNAQIPHYFPIGSDSKGTRPALWKNWDDFVQKSKNSLQAARALERIAANGDGAAVAAAAKKLGATCKACHDPYHIEAP